MPRIPRSLLLDADRSFHKVWRGHNREWNLGNAEEKQTYLRMLSEEVEGHPNPLHAFCVMDNHSHEMFTLSDLPRFSNFMRRHHGRYGQYFNKRHDRIGKVAQDRPKTIAIHDEAHEMTVTFYIHANPLRAKLVRDAKDYAWSTHRLYAFGRREPWMKQIVFPQWYIHLAGTMEERQRKYRQLFDAYLREFGLIKQAYSIYGVGDLLWQNRRRETILKSLRQLTRTELPP